MTEDPPCSQKSVKGGGVTRSRPPRRTDCEAAAGTAEQVMGRRSKEEVDEAAEATVEGSAPRGPGADARDGGGSPREREYMSKGDERVKEQSKGCSVLRRPYAGDCPSSSAAGGDRALFWKGEPASSRKVRGVDICAACNAYAH
eukprot:GHVU01223547.1.p2 GENE.GHVU01223547.1~~GHVU01223547.1.p2  ORF type:complete len:144 (+),score=11.40 GHVU01223547.1:515-946(+)